MLLALNDSEISFELKSVDFHRQFFSGCLYEQAGRHPLREFVP